MERTPPQSRGGRGASPINKRKETVDEDDDVVERLQSSPTHFGRSLSEATDDLVTVSPDRETQLPSKRYEVPDLHLGRLGTQKPGLMSPLPRFSARLTNGRLALRRARRRRETARPIDCRRPAAGRGAFIEIISRPSRRLRMRRRLYHVLEDDHWVRRVWRQRCRMSRCVLSNTVAYHSRF